MAGTVLDRLTPSISSNAIPRRCSSQSSSAAYSSGMRTASVSSRQVAVSSSPSNVPSLMFVLPMSTASNTPLTAQSVAGHRPLPEGEGVASGGGCAATAAYKPGVEAGVGRELGMEGRGEQVALAGGDHVAVGQRGQRFGFWPDALDDRGADEDGVQWLLQPGKRQVDLEAVDLPAERVALHRQVHQSDTAIGLATDDIARQQDHACARSPHG